MLPANDPKPPQVPGPIYFCMGLAEIISTLSMLKQKAAAEKQYAIKARVFDN